MRGQLDTNREATMTRFHLLVAIQYVSFLGVTSQVVAAYFTSKLDNASRLEWWLTYLGIAVSAALAIHGAVYALAAISDWQIKRQRRAARKKREQAGA